MGKECGILEFSSNGIMYFLIWFIVKNYCSNFIVVEQKKFGKKLGYNEQLKENIFPITLILGNAIELNSFPIEITGIV